MFLENFNKFLKYYGKGRYLKLAGFTGLSFIAGCLEFVGIALIYPFIILILQPENLPNFHFIKLDDSYGSGLLIGIIVFFIFILKNLFIILSQYIQSKFVSLWKQDIINKFMKYYIYSPYKASMKVSSIDKLYLLETVCPQVVNSFIMRVLNLLTNSTIIFMVILLLLIKFPIPALITIVFVCVSMFIQNKYFKKRTADIASELIIQTANYKKALLQNINNLKDLKILSAEKIFYDNFLESGNALVKVNYRHGFYASIPPYIIEILVVASLFVMAFILSLQNLNENSTLIASFAVVVAALFRIAPALNRIQSSIININATRKFVKCINDTYEKYGMENFEAVEPQTLKRIDFQDKISLKNICFSYNESKQVLKNISIDINKGDFVGIIGLSGAGKSTLADVLTGLLPVDTGEITVDNVALSQNNFASFRQIIGYIPQQINILDASVRENVAWGCETINDEGVIKALKAACLYDVISEFQGGINAKVVVGSNGLSQGQKQRLAIARALYRDPEILIFDEATSALDVQVESEITEMLTHIAKSKTIIAIAHRLSTLKACNKLIYMKDGQIVDVGSFEELSDRYDDFASLVKLSSIK